MDLASLCSSAKASFGLFFCAHRIFPPVLSATNTQDFVETQIRAPVTIILRGVFYTNTLPTYKLNLGSRLPPFLSLCYAVFRDVGQYAH
jgi:hypothetical protein